MPNMEPGRHLPASAENPLPAVVMLLAVPEQVDAVMLSVPAVALLGGAVALDAAVAFVMRYPTTAFCMASRPTTDSTANSQCRSCRRTRKPAI